MTEHKIIPERKCISFYNEDHTAVVDIDCKLFTEFCLKYFDERLLAQKLRERGYKVREPNYKFLGIF